MNGRRKADLIGKAITGEMAKGEVVIYKAAGGKAYPGSKA